MERMHLIAHCAAILLAGDQEKRNRRADLEEAVHRSATLVELCEQMYPDAKEAAAGVQERLVGAHAQAAVGADDLTERRRAQVG